MKKINIKFLSLLTLTAGLWASCADEVVVKDEADKNIFPASAVAISDMKLVENGNKTITVSAVVANADTLNAMEYGFIYSTDENLSDPASVKVSVKEDGEMSAKLPIAPSTTYYVAAYAYVRGAAVQTEAITVTTNAPDPITLASLDGAVFYATGISDVWGESSYNFEATLVAGNGDSIFVCNLDPYFATNGIVASNGSNILGGVLAISEDGSSATITCSSAQPMGYSDALFMGFDPTANGGEGDFANDIVLTIKNYGAAASLTPGYGVYTPGQGGFYTLFSAFELTRK